MAEKIKVKIIENEVTIDEDSPEIKDSKSQKEKHSSNIAKRKNHHFSLNVFLYSYPFTFRYMKSSISSLKRHPKV